MGSVSVIVDYDKISEAQKSLKEIEKFEETFTSKIEEVITELEEISNKHENSMLFGIENLRSSSDNFLADSFTQVSDFEEALDNSLSFFKDAENKSNKEWINFINENEATLFGVGVKSTSKIKLFDDEEEFKQGMTAAERSRLEKTMAKITGKAYSILGDMGDETPDKNDSPADTGDGDTPTGNTLGTGGYSPYSGTGAITTATAFSTVNQARVENTSTSTSEKSETVVENTEESPSTDNETATDTPTEETPSEGNNNSNNTSKPSTGGNNNSNNTSKPSTGENNNQTVTPPSNNTSTNTPSSRPQTSTGGSNYTGGGSNYTTGNTTSHYATANNDQITTPETGEGSNISETTPSAPESDTNISSSAGEELDVISIDRGNNKTSSASAGSNDGGNVVPTILGVGVAAGAAVAGAKYIKDKKEKDNTYEDNIGEEDAFSYLGDYEGDLSDENAPRTTKYKAGNVNKLVLDDSDGEVKIEDNYQESTEQKEELE